MDNIYTNIYKQGNKLYLRGINSRGKYIKQIQNFSPTLFINDDKGDSNYKSIYDQPLKKLEFEDLDSARDFIDNYSDVSNITIFGQKSFEYQYLTTKFPGNIQYNINDIDVVGIDIETTVEHGFPDCRNPLEEILLITVTRLNGRQAVTYGTKKLTKNLADVEYKYFSTEKEMLTAFIGEWSRNYPDIVSGWNTDVFDIPYLIERCNKIVGEQFSRNISPFKVLKKKEVNIQGEMNIFYDIKGIASLDYLELYKKYSYTPQEQYSLDHIAKEELGAGKLENPYSTFKQWYENDWDTFVEYNTIDVSRVLELEDKMKLIELVVTIAYSAKCNYEDVYSPVKTWECLIYNNLWERNILIPFKKRTTADRQISGGYVKTPVPGKYDWVVVFDATSLYPSIMMQYNMSPEKVTYIPDQYNPFININDIDDRVNLLLTKDVDNSYFIENNICFATNGSFFKRDSLGILPGIIQKMFDDRQTFKKQMLAKESEFELIKNNADNKTKKEFGKQISSLNIYQNSRKVLLNALYGASANENFIFFNDDVAEAITSTGRLIIQTVSAAINEWLTKITGVKKDYICYCDTDSCMVELGPIVEKYYPNKTKKEIVEIVDNICKDKITKVINDSCAILAQRTNAFENKISFKRETISDAGIFVAKKKYLLNVYNKEGVTYEKPKTKIVGLEIVRSSTPTVVRKILKEAVKVTLEEGEVPLQKFIKNEKQKYKLLTPEEIAFPRSVNNLGKYKSDSSIYNKGTPIAVRGALLYNYHIQPWNKTYPNIKEGEKVKFLYLKVPNTIHENCIAFIDKIPQELKLDSYVDYETMWEKSFISPMESIIQGLGWSVEEKVTLDSLWS